MWRLSGFVLLLFMVWGGRDALACTPIQPDYWFSEMYQIEGDLPQGLRLQAGQLDGFEVHNDGEQTLYIARSSGSGFSAAYPIGADYGIWLNEGLLMPLVPTLERRNVQADNRPVDVEVPEPQRFTLYLLDEQHLYAVPILLSYTLNADYDPTIEQRSLMVCQQVYDAAMTQEAAQRAQAEATLREAQQQTTNVVIYAALIAVGIVVLVVGVWRWRR